MDVTDVTAAIAEVPEQVRLLRQSEFRALLETGAFDDEDVELLCGFVVVREQASPEHENAVRRILRFLAQQLHDRAQVDANLSLTLSEYSLPRPDVMVVPVGDYWHVHPSRTYLTVEVANASLRKDRGLKRKMYAAAEVDEYWIVNVVDREVEVFRDRVDGAFRSHTVHHPGEILRPVAFPDVAIAVADIVPPAS